MSPSSLTDLQAPAKLNVFLRVVGRRADGYHLLQSLFVLLDWQDTLHLEVRTDGQIHRHDLGQALPPDDLCLRAARLLQRHGGCALGADISVDKVVPSGAGLGGGSSDAATVLMGLNRLWGLNWGLPALADLGVQLGADIPFFLGGGSAIVEGIGERLTPVALRPRHYLVVKPPVGVSTQTIFQDPSLARDSDAAIVTGFLADPSVMDSMLDGDAYFPNDLQAVAVRHAPVIGSAVEWLTAHWGNGQMTGSGSAVFARETVANASLMATTLGHSLLQARPEPWEARWCRSLVQHPVVGRLG
jgi:4-diphosphocytidyl-2-C-methyl-D-erythritol kinase